MAAVVPDASVAVKWVLDEPGSREALALARGWAARGVRVLVPTLFWSEVANVLHRRALDGRLRPDRARWALAELLQARLETRPEQALVPSALDLAQRLGLPSVYDAIYLAVAEAEGAELWSFDQRLVGATSPELPWVRLAWQRAR